MNTKLKHDFDTFLSMFANIATIPEIAERLTAKNCGADAIVKKFWEEAQHHNNADCLMAATLIVQMLVESFESQQEMPVN